MDMGSMTPSSLAGMAMSTMTSGSPSMSMSTGAMDSSMSMGMGTCKISMLWNWDTVDACFISSTWQIKSRGMFAGSCIGVVALVCALEFLRRLGREYDRFILLSAQGNNNNNNNTRAQFRQYSPLVDNTKASEHTQKPPLSGAIAERITEYSSNGNDAHNHSSRSTSSNSSSSIIRLSEKVQFTTSPPLRPSLLQQLTRAVLHMLQFGLGYFIMLLAMYYNGYIIICILLGALVGFLIFSWDLGGAGGTSGATQQEASGCCG